MDAGALGSGLSLSLSSSLLFARVQFLGCFGLFISHPGFDLLDLFLPAIQIEQCIAVGEVVSTENLDLGVGCRMSGLSAVLCC